MATWALAGAGFGMVLFGAAITQPIRRRPVAIAATLAYALVAMGAGTLRDSFWLNLFAPGALLLIGYWLSGFFFRDPQAWLEQWLLSIDHSLWADRWMSQLPRVGRELLELSYAAAYVVVGGGAIYAATFGLEAILDYWALVLTSELASYAALPWLRSRPPRSIERPALTAPATLRRLNATILDHASVQANTLPSGHVSGAVAAALAVMALDPVAGGGLMLLAGVIAFAAMAGRYHYVVDCVAGAAVAAGVWSLM